MIFVFFWMPKSSLLLAKLRVCEYRNAEVPKVSGAGSEKRDLFKMVLLGDNADENSNLDLSNPAAFKSPGAMLARFVVPFHPPLSGKEPA